MPVATKGEGSWRTLGGNPNKRGGGGENLASQVGHSNLELVASKGHVITGVVQLPLWSLLTREGYNPDKSLTARRDVSQP